MANIFIPFVYHNNIDNKYYIVKTSKPIGSKDNVVKDSSVFNTGIRLSRCTDFSDAYLFLIEMLMLYDTCYISQEDLVYLYSVLGKDDTELLLKSGSIKVYNSQSLKLALLEFGGKYTISANYADLNQAKQKRKIYSLVSSYPSDNLFKEWYIKSIIRNYDEAFFINDVKSILDDASKKSLEDLLNSDILGIIEESKSEATAVIDYKQTKLNRLLHLHYYLNLTKHIGCEFLYVPEELNSLFDYFKMKDISKNTLESLFSNIKMLEQIPDITRLVSDGELSISDIIEIRKTKEAKKFRDWMSALNEEASNFTDDEVKAFYHDACMRNSKFSKLYNSKKGNLVKTSISLLTGNLPGVSIASSIIDLLLALGLDTYNPSKFTRDQLFERIRNKATK